MAVSPKASKSGPRNKAGSMALSASEALKAAEAAISTTPSKKPALPKAAPTKAKPIDGNRQGKTAASKPVAASKPAPVKSAAAVAATITSKAVVEPIARTAAPKSEIPISEIPIPKFTESLIEKAEAIATQPLPAEGTKVMNDVIETGKKFAEDTKAKFETAYTDFNEKTKSHVEKSTKAIEEMSDIAKGNVEAMVESGKIAAKAMETLGQDAVDYSRKNFEKATASFKTFSTVKTPTEFFQLQSQMFSSSFDEFAKEAAKSSEAMMKMAGDITQPLTARVTLVTDKVKSLAA